MKSSHDKQYLATLALIGSGIMGGLAALSSKIVLRELPPLTVLFVRITIMLLVLWPLALRYTRHSLTHWRQIALLAVFWLGNVVLFIVGVKYTTATASQVLYASVPIFVFLESFFVGGEKVRSFQVLGIILGFVGALVTVFDPAASGNGAFGSLYGNVLIFIASMSWSLYLVFSKRLSSHISPLGLTVGSASVGWILTGILMLMFEGTSGLVRLPVLSAVAFWALLFVGLGVGAAMIILVQWGVKYGSPLVAGSMVYLSTFIAAATGIAFLGEIITTRFLFGSALLLLGLFLTSTLPLLLKKARAVALML